MSEGIINIGPTGGQFATARARTLDPAELDFARAKLQAGTPLSAVANMLRRPVDSLRVYFPPATPVKPTPPIGVGLVAIPNRGRPRPSKRQRPQCAPERFRAVMRAVAQAHGITMDDLIGPSQKRIHARPRDKAAWRMFQMGASYSQIGRWMGGRDHTTALVAVRRHAALLAEASEAA